MKKYILLLIVPFLSFTQIDQGDYTSKYIEHYDYNYSQDTYLPTGEDSGWLDINWYFTEDYYSMFAEGDSVKFWYEYAGEIDFDGVRCDAYNIEDGRMLLVDYDNQRLLFFTDLDENDIYQTMTMVTKIEKN